MVVRGGQHGPDTGKATATYTLTSGLLHESVDVPPSGKMKIAYVGSSSITYDAKNHRYVETWLGNDAGWSISYAKPWSGNTETWTTCRTRPASSARNVIVRTPARFDFTNYETIGSAKPVFKGYCTR